MERKKENSRPILRRACILLFWLFVWQLAAMLADNEILLATPLQTVSALVGLLGKEVFWRTVGMSLCRIALGFLLGLTAALLLAWGSSKSALFQELLSPVMTLCKAVPVAVFVVLLLIWWGSSFLAVAVCFLIVLPNIYISTLEGLQNADKKLLEMAEVFALPKRTRFFYIYRPAVQPFLSSSLKLSLGMCWKSGVAAEVIGTPAYSIGEQLYLSKIQLDTAGVFAWAAVVILLSAVFERLVLRLAEGFFRWEPECRTARREGVGESREKRTAQTGGNAAAGECPGRTLRVEKLCKSYGSLQVLKEVNAVYEAGQIYYLTSPSGSGKTTFLRILCGLERADGGRITQEPAEFWDNMVFSMVFQEDRLCEGCSAVRNVEMVTGSRNEAERALHRLLPEEALYKPCSQLSGGQKRRAALVRAMESQSDCVLLDEPFTGMDEETRKQAEQYIRERQDGRIVIIATHISCENT